MEDDPESDFRKIVVPGDKPIQISKWKVKTGSNISKGVVLAIYDVCSADKQQKNLKLKATDGGIVKRIEIKEGVESQPGSLLLTIENQTIEPCCHPTVMKDMCAVCGADLRSELGLAGDRKESVAASVAMVHSIPELIVSEEEALKLGQEDENRLLQTRKLVLLVDLDQTLIHTTNDNIPPKLKDVKHFQLPHGPKMLWYHTRFRPHTQEFLEKISQLYELHICTFGVRMYAHTIARLLDPKEMFFSHRILSRDECFNALSKTANLKALFPCGDSMVCIIDDREDVWNFSPNLIHVKPYRFFQGTADINAPPGLTKTENDDIPVTHRVRRASDSQDGEKPETGPESEKMEAHDSQANGKSEVVFDSTAAKDEGEDITDKKIQTKEKEDDGKDVQANGTGLETDENSADKDVTSKTQSEKKETEETVSGESKQGLESDGENLESEGAKTGDESPVQPEEEIEWEDEDDYLFHLEEILTRIHKAFYDLYDQTKSKESKAKLPNLKDIIPYVKKKVLKGCNIVFSGVVPLNMPPEKSRAYIVAKGLGASIQSSLVPRKGMNKAEATTHLVASKVGTAKVNSAIKMKGIAVVSVNWLWTCAERWEKVEEVLFPLEDGGSALNSGPWGNREGRPQSPNSVKRKSDEMIELSGSKEPQDSESCKKTRFNESDDDDQVFGEWTNEDVTVKAVAGPSRGQKSTNATFAASYNPLFSFSDEDIEFMDKEVEETMEEEESDSEEENEEDRSERIRKCVLGDVSESSEEDSLSGEYPRGWNVKKHSPDRKQSSDEERKTEQVEAEGSTDNELENYEKTVEAFSRDKSVSSESGESIGSVDDELADAVEKEFLSLL